MDLSCLDLKRIREDYLCLTLRELGDLLGVSAAYCLTMERSAEPTEEYMKKFRLLILDKRIQCLESIVKSCEHDTRFLRELKNADQKEKCL